MNEESKDTSSLVTRTGGEGEIRTFLIADVRGYTKFTHSEGDEKAAELAAAFATLVREVVGAGGGAVVELRGDEALSAFTSARQALRAAIDLQARFTQWEFPLGIGIGLDAGEAVPVEGGYRGEALNVASRLCEAAGPGQILTTETVARLASRLAGVRVLPARPMRLNGFERPLLVHEVVPEPEATGEAGVGRLRRRWAWAALAGAVLLGGILAAVLALHGENAPTAAADHSAANHSSTGGPKLTAAQDPPTISYSGRSIGPVKLGMSRKDVHDELGTPESTTDWGSVEGKAGDNELYYPNGHYLQLAYYKDNVVQIKTTDPYYKTPTGVGVGVTFPTIPGPGVTRIRPGVYQWRGIVNGLGPSDWCVQGFGAVTRFDTPVSAAGGNRIVDVTMVEEEFFAPLIDWETGGNYPIQLKDLRC